MFENRTEAEARQEILDAVSAYCDRFHNQKKPFQPGDRINYASRVYNIVTASRSQTNSPTFSLAGRHCKYTHFSRNMMQYM